jgi:hypothetical protein
MTVEVIDDDVAHCQQYLLISLRLKLIGCSRFLDMVQTWTIYSGIGVKTDHLVRD